MHVRQLSLDFFFLYDIKKTEVTAFLKTEYCEYQLTV